MKMNTNNVLFYWYLFIKIDVDEADPADSPIHEFVSDAYQSQTLSKDLKEVQEGIKRLGAKKGKNSTGK